MSPTKTEATEQGATPRFAPREILSHGDPTIVTDVDGIAWRVDPRTGLAAKVVFSRD